MIRVRQVKLNILDDNIETLIKMVCKKIKIKKNDILEYKIVKKSIDARYKPELFYIYELDVKVCNEEDVINKNKNNLDVFASENQEYVMPSIGDIVLNKRIVVVGSGPAGLFCAYLLASMGYKPLVIERGERLKIG